MDGNGIDLSFHRFIVRHAPAEVNDDNS